MDSPSNYFLAFIMQALVFWIFLQFWRASWHSSKAKDPWISLLRTDVGRFLFPVYKWFSPVACVSAAIGACSSLFLMFVAIFGR